MGCRSIKSLKMSALCCVVLVCAHTAQAANKLPKGEETRLQGCVLRDNTDALFAIVRVY